MNLDDFQICLECITFVNTCLEFSKRSKQIQAMFEEAKSCEDKEQINSLRILYDLQPVQETDTEMMKKDHGFHHTIVIANEINSTVIFEEGSEIDDEDFMIEEHLEENCPENDLKEHLHVEKLSKSETEMLYNYQCHVCEAQFPKMQQLSNHCKKDHNEACQVECTCGKLLSSWKRLMDHRTRHFKDEDGYKCNECKLSYKTQQAYDKHVNKKHGANAIKFICSVCGRSFKEKQILKNHEKIHLPDEEKLKYPCKFCHKKFINSHCLKVHVARIHEKVSYFFCEICGKGCTTKSDLLWHMDKHTQERNHPCDVCGLKFKSTNSLRNHKRRHEAIEANKQCPICKKEFRSNTALNNHKLVHSNEKRYQCQYCQNSYKRLETYKCHLSTHTGIR